MLKPSGRTGLPLDETQVEGGGYDIRTMRHVGILIGVQTQEESFALSISRLILLTFLSKNKRMTEYHILNQN